MHILILTHDLCKFKLCIKQSIFLNETSKNVIIERLKSVWCVCARASVCWCYLTRWRGVCPGCIALDSCAAGSNTVVTHHLPCTHAHTNTLMDTHTRISMLWFKQTGTSTTWCGSQLPTAVFLGLPLSFSLSLTLSHSRTHTSLRKQCQSFAFLFYSQTQPDFRLLSLSRKECVLIGPYTSITAAPKHQYSSPESLTGAAVFTACVHVLRGWLHSCICVCVCVMCHKQ